MQMVCCHGNGVVSSRAVSLQVAGGSWLSSSVFSRTFRRAAISSAACSGDTHTGAEAQWLSQLQNTVACQLPSGTLAYTRHMYSAFHHSGAHYEYDLGSPP